MLHQLIPVGIIIIAILVTPIVHHRIKKKIKKFVSHQKSRAFRHVPVNVLSEIHYMDHLNGYEFEDYTSWLLKRNGFIGIKQTGKNHDFGLDVLAYRHHISYGIQCKHYKNRKIKRQTIKHTADGAHFYKMRIAVVLTNTRFSPAAVQAHKFFHVQLWGRPVLIKLIKHAVAQSTNPKQR